MKFQTHISEQEWPDPYLWSSGEMSEGQDRMLEIKGP